jgi:hypothetical protein
MATAAAPQFHIQTELLPEDMVTLLCHYCNVPHRRSLMFIGSYAGATIPCPRCSMSNIIPRLEECS